MTRSLAADLAYALDPVLFARDVLDFDPDPWQGKFLGSPSRRILLNCSRQSGKSTTTAVLATHTALYQPGALILLIAPAERQSKELFSKVAQFLKAVEPSVAMEEDNKKSATLSNGSRIVALPGDGRTIRGFSSPSLIVEDEAAFVGDETHTSIRPMLAVGGGRLILMSTPNGRRGHFFDAWENGGPAWQRIKVRADECPRIAPEFLEDERATLGDWRYRQEYFCHFTDNNDQVFSFDEVMAALSDDEPLCIAPLVTTAWGALT